MVSIIGNLHEFSVGITRYPDLNTGFLFSYLYSFPRVQYWADSHIFYNLHVGAVDFLESILKIWSFNMLLLNSLNFT